MRIKEGGGSAFGRPEQSSPRRRRMAKLCGKGAVRQEDTLRFPARLISRGIAAKEGKRKETSEKRGFSVVKALQFEMEHDA